MVTHTVDITKYSPPTKWWRTTRHTSLKMATMSLQSVMENGWFRKLKTGEKQVIDPFLLFVQQSQHYRFNENCWKLAYAEDDKTSCPSDMGHVWKYKVERRGQYYKEWHDAGDDLQIVCEPGDIISTCCFQPFLIAIFIFSWLQPYWVGSLGDLFSDLRIWHQTAIKDCLPDGQIWRQQLHRRGHIYTFLQFGSMSR